jgi:hypothetical protein
MALRETMAKSLAIVVHAGLAVDAGKNTDAQNVANQLTPKRATIGLGLYGRRRRFSGMMSARMGDGGAERQGMK